MNELVERVAFSVAAFFVAALPERVKARHPWKDYSTTAGHVVSGAVETAVAVFLFGAGYVAFVGKFSARFGFAFVSNLPNPTTSDLGRMGILGFVSYLLTPWAMASFWCIVEGVLRVLDAVLSNRHLGMAFVSAPHWLWLQWRDWRQRARLESSLGPARPDRIEHPDVAPDGCLRVTCRDPKPWSDVQVVEFEERFYLLVERTMVPDGGAWAYRYRLRPLDPSEVLRGRVVPYEAPTANPAAVRSGATGEPPTSGGERDTVDLKVVRRPGGRSPG